MAKKAKTPQELLYSYEEKILASRKRWDYLKKNGGSSPFYADGCDLNLVRNHMIYYQHLMEEICRENKLPLPQSYYMELPPLMDDSYMVRSEEIRVHAKESLSLYMADENYLFIKKHAYDVDEKTGKTFCIQAVLGYVRGLTTAIAEDNLIIMRCHENNERYMESFSECRKKIEGHLLKKAEYNIPYGQQISLSMLGII